MFFDHAMDTPPDVVLEGHFVPDEQQTYRHVPFHVPAGVSQIHFHIDYSDQISSDVFVTGGNTLDVGVFDQRGSESGSSGFRGWSGSNKRDFTIGCDWATPPYRPGVIEPGAWQMLLGAYKVGPVGMDYTINIWFDPGIEYRAREAFYSEGEIAEPTPPIESGWIRGDLHSHSLASDGDSPLEDLLHEAKRVRLDFLGVTDHNAAILPVQPAGAESSAVLIPGIEVTTYSGHWNVWGADRWFDFRLQDSNAVEVEMAKAKSAGGFVSLNHPRPLGPPWGYGLGIGYEAIEVWNGDWRKLNSACLAFWDLHLSLENRVVAVAGSDTHFLTGEDDGFIPRAKLGEPTIWVKPEEPGDSNSIVDELRAGRSFVSASPSGPQLLIGKSGEREVEISTRGASGSTLMLISSGQSIDAAPIDGEDWADRFSTADATHHVRAQIVDGYGTIEALTNALWLD